MATISPLPAGKFQVRHEVKMIVDTQHDSDRLAGLIDQALDDARKEYHRGKIPCPTIREALPEFIKFLSVEQGNDPGTIKRTRRRLLRFAEDLGGEASDIKAPDIRRDDLHAWMQRRLADKGKRYKREGGKGITKDVVNSELGTLQFFARWCHQQGYCKSDLDLFAVPRFRVRGKIKGRWAPRALSVPAFMEIMDKLRVADPTVEIILRGMLLFGARPEAMFAMDWSDVDFPEGEAAGVVRVPAVKYGVESAVPVRRGSRAHLLLVEARENWGKFHGRRPLPHEHKPVFTTRAARSTRRPMGWTTSNFDAALERAVKKAGIKNRFTAYDARHCALTWLADKGLKDVEIQHYAKHLRVSTQEIYRWTSGIAAASAYSAMEKIVDGAARREEGGE